MSLQIVAEKKVAGSNGRLCRAHLQTPFVAEKNHVPYLILFIYFFF